MTNSFENENLTQTYINVVTSIALNCAAQIKGVASISNDVSSQIENSSKSKKNNAISISSVNGLLVIDLYINIIYGYVIPKIVCELQEEIKKEVEKTTAYKIKSINVNIVGVVASN